LLIATNINSLTVSKEQNPNDIHLEAPYSSDRIHSNRPPIEPSTNVTRKKTKPKKPTNKDSTNPCNGSLIKTNGTTCGLKEIMIGRCYEYQYIKQNLFLTNQS